MNVPAWIAWIIVVGLAAISVVIFIGKADFLIAGYNTSSKQKKEEYNVSRLRKILGAGLFVITIIVALIVFFEGELPWALAFISPWGIFGVIAIVFLLSNTICKK
jgi:hypothetical protein